MKKWLVGIIVGMMLIISGCSDEGAAPGNAGQSTVQNVVKKKKLVIGTNPGYFPFEMVDQEGKFVGYDIDFANAIAKELGAEVEVKQYGFDGLVPALQAGEIDMIFAGMTITGERALAVSFANPYYKTGQAIMVPAGNTTKKWQDLDQDGKKIAVQIGTTGALLSKDLFKKAKIQDFEDFPAAALALQSGQVDAVIYDEPAIDVWNLQHKGSVQKVEGVISAESLGIAIKKNDYETIQWLNSFLDSYIGSPAELSSRTKWFENNEWLNKVKN